MTIKCITFDLDDTLWDCYPVITRAEEQFYEWTEKYYPEVSASFDLQSLIRHRQEYFKQFSTMQHDFTWLRKKWLEHIATKYHYPLEFIEHGFNVFWKARNQVTLFEGVRDVLTYVKQNYKVVSITNGNADVDEVGIGDYFHHAVSASDAGAAKPSPAIFEKALSLTGSLAEETVHVGDDPVRDVKGAAALGMKTVWVNMTSSVWDELPKPDVEIRHISQLTNALKELESR